MSWFGMHDGFDDEMQKAPDIFARKPPTNYDRIISKTPEELARYMAEVQMQRGCPNDGAMDCRDNCAVCWLDWLKQEAE